MSAGASMCVSAVVCSFAHLCNSLYVYIFSMDHGLECLNHICTLWSKFLIEVFYHTKIKIWNFWASSNRHYSLIHNVYKLSKMISCWNLHWEYFLINGIYKWRHEDGHMTLLGYANWFENFQIKCQPKQNLWSWSLGVINLVKRYHAVCRPECVLGKS